MKKILLLALTATMLFTVAPAQTAAAASCSHTVIRQSWFWVPEGHGYTHTYYTSSGTRGCGVTIEKEGYYEICCNCSTTVRTVYTGKTRDNHEVKSHNTW